jgi:hypothetical protein
MLIVHHELLPECYLRVLAPDMAQLRSWRST